MSQFRVGESNPISRTKRHNSEPVEGEIGKRLRIEKLLDILRNGVHHERREKCEHSDGVSLTTTERTDLTDGPKEDRDPVKAIIASAKRNVNRSDTAKYGGPNAQSINPDPAAVAPDTDGPRTSDNSENRRQRRSASNTAHAEEKAHDNESLATDRIVYMSGVTPLANGHKFRHRYNTATIEQSDNSKLRALMSVALGTADADDHSEKFPNPECDQTQRQTLASHMSRKDPSPRAEEIASDNEEGLETPVSAAEELYEIDTEDVTEELHPRPLNGAKPWSSLPSPPFAVLDTLTLHVGDTILVCLTEGRDSSGLAKISSIKSLPDGRCLLVLVWYYTRLEIVQELKVGRKIPKVSREHLNRFWPVDAPYTHMLSTNRTITMWDTAQGKATPEVMRTICTDKMYVTTDSVRQICGISELRYRWIKDILKLSPPGN